MNIFSWNIVLLVTEDLYDKATIRNIRGSRSPAYFLKMKIQTKNTGVNENHEYF